MKKLEYCKDALDLLGIRVICGQACPILDRCPRLIMEDATDKAIEKAIREMIKIAREDNAVSKS